MSRLAHTAPENWGHVACVREVHLLHITDVGEIGGRHSIQDPNGATNENPSTSAGITPDKIAAVKVGRPLSKALVTLTEACDACA